MIDIPLEVRNIIAQVTDNMMRSTHYEPNNHEEMYELLTGECSNILAENFLDGKYIPLEYNAIRNGLADTLWNIFEPHIQKEHGTNE